MRLFEFNQHIGRWKVLVNTDDIADSAITTDKIADEAVTEEKLSQDLRAKLGLMVPTISLGFYSDDEVPVPLLSLSIRPEHINEVVVPYLLIAQQDVSETVVEWKWERESSNAELDEAWNNSGKARQRKLTLTADDFPTGWTASRKKIAFRCFARFNYENSIQTLMNVVTVI